MAISQVPHRTLLDEVAGRVAAFLLDGGLKEGEQLPSERELISQLGVSRATLREGLRSLADRGLLEARPGVGWFVRSPDPRYLSDLHELARPYREEAAPAVEVLSGPRRLEVVVEKPLHVPNLQTDRLGTFELISWWERDRVREAKVLVVGAGALGNEVVKNLTLMGIGHVFLVDFDTVEAANLSRSVFFREDDTGRAKAEVVAARAKSLNPDVRVQYLHGDVTTQLGLGVIRRMDVVIGCLDNREARLAVNRFCYWMNKPWVDGAIQELQGLARVFVPGEGACYECTLTEQARRELSLRYSCPLLARTDILLGKVPTTPTIASFIGAIEAQEALKLIHRLPVEAGKVIHYNGRTNDMYTSAYLPREDCESHWVYGEVQELPLRASQATLADLLRLARADLGPDATLELDQELIVALECRVCGTYDRVLKPLSEVSLQSARCPTCGEVRETHMTHRITGEEDFLDRTLARVGVPPLHILRAHNAEEFRFYELTGDLEETLHFRHFEGARDGRRIRLGGEVQLGERSTGRAEGRVVFKD
ncbi:MAG TPA: ThiF family adenylyltransferase [Anaerolineales bacterium]|nr:ThiF family adenylyltransferase [Anaerolineales bacterium]